VVWCLVYTNLARQTFPGGGGGGVSPGGAAAATSGSSESARV